jgi:putative ABC transport system permease protein
MLSYYLRTALRTMLGSKLYSAINIVGLGIGLGCCLLILLFVRHELSYENSFANAKRIYRLSREFLPFEGARARMPASNNAPVLPALLADFSELAAGGRVFGGSMNLARGDTAFNETELRFADQGLLQVFDFTWLAGDSQHALIEPGSVVLSASLARKYFGSEVALPTLLGERLQFEQNIELRVTGVIADLPDTTHLSLSGMVSMPTLVANFGQRVVEQWNSNTDFYTYVLLRDGLSIDSVQSKFADFLTRHVGADMAKLSTLVPMNIRDIHLHSTRDEEWKPRGNINTVYSFLSIALAVLAIACMNFMSIATARGAQRAKEVGMRLSLGASRAQLAGQFLLEALLFSVLALLIALLGVELLLPAYSNLVGATLQLDYLQDAQALLTFMLLTFGVTLCAGLYPALYLSAFEPAKVLKGDLTRGRNGQRFRQVMVVMQFAIAIVLISATWVMQAQRKLADNIALGFNKDSIVVLSNPAPNGFQQDWPLLKQRLQALPGVAAVSSSHFLPFGFNDNQLNVKRPASSNSSRIQMMLVDYDFFATYDITLLAGRGFDAAFPNDMLQSSINGAAVPLAGVVLNESAAKALGMTAQTAVDELVDSEDVGFHGRVVGVAANTAFESIHRSQRPLIFLLNPPESPAEFIAFRSAAVRLSDNANAQTLAAIQQTWAELYPNTKFSLRYLNDDFRAMYQSEVKQSQVFRYFATLAIIIACFGLFGLAAFNAERRTKEIGVRKVMGGSVWSIVLLLTNDFSRLVLLSNLLAWPVAYYAMHRWLENFAYRIELTPLIFIGSGFIALCIAWVTVGGTAAKAASQKPVLALRYE